ncbi:MAG: hypothetical protein JW881_06510 [Spirochaetales bacterium]|nr:hypothetical protein [Spirochaetales bacterium]
MMGESSGYERRKEQRVGADRLPENLRKFSVSFGSDDTVESDTIDLSVGGISLNVPVSVKDIDGYTITLTTLDNKISLKEEILGIRSLGDSRSRISIMFSRNNSYKEYFREILSAVAVN